MSFIIIDPTKETAVQSHKRPLYNYRYAYARSADSQSTDDTGQDFLTIKEDEQKIIFAVCDGVSQSFFGDLAARLLGEALVQWLDTYFPTSHNDFCDTLQKLLSQLPKTTSRHVNNFVISEDTPSILQEVLEQKRALGSESTFICGRIDLPGDNFPDGRMALAWMGDSRLRLWGTNGERSQVLGDTFRTDQRWSTRKGPVNGTPNCFISSLAGLTRVAAYTDGLAALDAQPTLSSNEEINALIDHSRRQPQSDDISFIDIVLNHQQRHLLAVAIQPPGRLSAAAQNGRIKAAWPPVTGATAYQVRLTTSSGSEEWQTIHREWLSPIQFSPGKYQLQVRAIQDVSFSDWTPPQEIVVTPADAPLPPPKSGISLPKSLAYLGIPALCLTLFCALLAIWPNSPLRTFFTPSTPTLAPTLVIPPTQVIPTPTLTFQTTTEVVTPPTETSTSSPTLTTTPSATTTSTPIKTATATLTPTMTITPTITLTPTPTLTPSITPMPSITLTATNTQIPPNIPSPEE